MVQSRKSRPKGKEARDPEEYTDEHHNCDFLRKSGCDMRKN
jgi:hypothetical protein